MEIIVLPLNSPGAEQLRTARLHSLAEAKEEFLPLLKWVICWYQQYASSNPTNLNAARVYDSDQSWKGLRQAFDAVTVRLDRVSGPFFENTLFGQPLNILHSQLRSPNLVRQGTFIHDRARPGLYYDLSSQTVF